MCASWRKSQRLMCVYGRRWMRTGDKRQFKRACPCVGLPQPSFPTWLALQAAISWGEDRVFCSTHLQLHRQEAKQEIKTLWLRENLWWGPFHVLANFEAIVNITDIKWNFFFFFLWIKQPDMKYLMLINNLDQKVGDKKQTKKTCYEKYIGFVIVSLQKQEPELL